MPHRFEIDLRFSTRTKLLGDIGEFLAPILLASVGFTNIVDLNQMQTNFKDADFLAERDGTYCISVKALSKFKKGSGLNSTYKPESNCRIIDDGLATARSLNATFALQTVQLDVSNYSAYFGTYTNLRTLVEKNGAGKSKGRFYPLLVVEVGNCTEEATALFRSRRW